MRSIRYTEGVQYLAEKASAYSPKQVEQGARNVFMYRRSN
jgi:hypothetical protein